MSGLSIRLTEIRSFLLPLSQLVALPIFFLLTSAISQQPAYFLALLLVLSADVFDTSPRNKTLVRDLMAGVATAIWAISLNDHDGMIFAVTISLFGASSWLHHFL